ARGRDVATSNAVFCFTTNALCAELTPADADPEVRSRLVDLGGVFTAPLMDRLDAVFVFNPLGEATLGQIAEDLLSAGLRRLERQLPEGAWGGAVRAEVVGRAALGDSGSSVRRLEAAVEDYLARVFQL